MRLAVTPLIGENRTPTYRVPALAGSQHLGNAARQIAHIRLDETMLGWIKRNARLRRIGAELYERIVAQARQPALFRDLGVPDTMEGRFELIVLHIVLVLERLKREGSEGQLLGQAVLERLIADMDDALRQIGIGDMGVPRRVQRAAAAVRERVRDYAPGLDPHPSRETAPKRLEDAFCEHIYGAGNAAQSPIVLSYATRLADYARSSRAALDGVSSSDLLAGRLDFADVESGRARPAEGVSKEGAP